VQHGDLAVSVQPRWIVVLEGVLALVAQEHTRKRLRKISNYHILWHEVPLKRLIVMKERWPDNRLEVVSFLSEDVIDQAAWYFDVMGIPVDALRYYEISDFCQMLKFNSDIRAVYDSDPENLYRFGQLGVQVVRGNDF
jgi:hypothetical protein